MLIVLVGNIGTGKTRFTSKLKKRARRVIVCPDRLEEELDNKEKVQKEIFKLLQENLAAGKTVVLDGNNLEKSIRDQWCSFAKSSKVLSAIIDFGPGSEESLQRRIAASTEYTAEKWRSIHESNIKLYEEPSGEEFFDRIMTIVD